MKKFSMSGNKSDMEDFLKEAVTLDELEKEVDNDNPDWSEGENQDSNDRYDDHGMPSVE